MNWAAVAKTGLTIAGALVPQVGAIEQLSKSIPALTGAAKEDAVVALAREALGLTETAASRDLLNDPEVEKAARAFVQAYVALQNVVAVKQATPVQPAA